MNKPFRVCLPSVLLIARSVDAAGQNKGKGRWQTGIEVHQSTASKGRQLDCPFNHAAQMVIK
jgi:hypothetical protein